MSGSEYLTLEQVAERLPNRPHPLTVRRWCKSGVRGVHLQFVKMGRTIIIRPEWVEEFATRLAAATAPPEFPHPSPARPQQCRHRPQAASRRQAAAEATCARFGL